MTGAARDHFLRLVVLIERLVARNCRPVALGGVDVGVRIGCDGTHGSFACAYGSVFRVC